MPETWNIYCDESSHLASDGHPMMGLGALSVSKRRSRDIARIIRDIKLEHRIPARQELKWGKISPTNVGVYKAVVDTFFDAADLRFRIVLANKLHLNHDLYSQTHDDWYYKIYFTLLTRLLDPSDRYFIYIDIKDTLGSRKLRSLRRILSNAMYDFDQTSIRNIQLVRSQDSALVQLADILIGASCYANRDRQDSAAKRSIVDQIKARSGYALTKSTYLGERKYNIFHWSGDDQKID